MKALTKENFLLYAAANYTNIECYSTEELYEDLNTFTYLKKLFTRYHESGDLKERLILNHLIKMYNIFNNEAATRMLFFKISNEHWIYLKSFLLFMNRMPEVICNIDIKDRRVNNIVSADIPIDIYIINQLRKL